MNQIARASLAALSLCLVSGTTYAVEEVAPQGEDPPGADQGHVTPGSEPNPSLTEKLGRNEGVITPPPTGDKDIYTDVPNPEAGTDKEIIKPEDLPQATPQVK